MDQAISARAVEDYQALRLLHSSGQLQLADQRLQGLMGEMELYSAARPAPGQAGACGIIPADPGGGRDREFEFGAAWCASRSGAAGVGHVCAGAAAAQCAARRYRQ